MSDRSFFLSDDQHDKTEPESLLTPQDGQNSLSPEKSSSPLSQKYKTNLHSASRLTLISERVYSQEMKLPDGVEIIRATPSAG